MPGKPLASLAFSKLANVLPLDSTGARGRLDPGVNRRTISLAYSGATSNDLCFRSGDPTNACAPLKNQRVTEGARMESNAAVISSHQRVLPLPSSQAGRVDPHLQLRRVSNGRIQRAVRGNQVPTACTGSPKGQHRTLAGTAFSAAENPRHLRRLGHLG